MIRKEKGLTLDQFGEKIGLKKSALSHIENDKSGLTPQIAKLIAHEFNVNEEWLRTGEGEMFNELSNVELVAQFLSSGDTDMKSNLMNNLIRLSSEDLELISSVVSFLAERKKKD